jgi:hypothetical protein
LLLLLRVMAERRAGAPLAKEQKGVVGKKREPLQKLGGRAPLRPPPPSAAVGGVG